MKLTKEIMLAFGFKEIWPNGNPTEPWWEHKNYPTFFKMPTADEFIARFANDSYNAGAESVRNSFRSVIGI